MTFYQYTFVCPVEGYSKLFNVSNGNIDDMDMASCTTEEEPSVSLPCGCLHGGNNLCTCVPVTKKMDHPKWTPQSKYFKVLGPPGPDTMKYLDWGVRTLSVEVGPSLNQVDPGVQTL